MKKRRRKAAYIDYDYEAAYMKSLHDLEEANAERMLKEGRVRSVYATKEIKAGDRLEVEIYPEFKKGERSLILDEYKKARQRKAQRNLNEKNSRKLCERTIEANFGNEDIWATLTYTDENMPGGLKEAQRDMQNYIRRLNTRRKKKGLKNAKYVYVTECSKKGRWHHHIVLDGSLGMDEVEQAWKKGRRNQVRRLHKDENGLSGMAAYITKQKHPEGEETGKYQKAWKASKGLKKPEIKKNHYKFRQKDIDEIVTGKAEIEDKLKKWYKADGYEMTSYEIKYNRMNGRFYISARMYRQKGGRDSGNNRRIRKKDNKRIKHRKASKRFFAMS